ncbi:MAG: hypothetical protein U0X73_16990 [Thermoanaerobaculia bacterium]
MNRRVLFSCAAIGVLVTAGARAETVVLKSPDKVEIVINHTAGQVEVYGNGQSQPLRRYDLQPDMTFEVSPHVEVVFAVKDPNPLLYAYKLKEAKTEENPDFKSLVDLAKELAKAAAGLEKAPKINQMLAKPANTVEPCLCDEVLQDSQTLQDGLPMLLSKIREHADSVSELTGRSFTNPAGVQEDVSDWHLEQNRKDLKAFRDLTDRLLEKASEVDGLTDLSPRLLVWKDSERDAADVLDKLDAFAALVKKLGIRQELHEVKELDPALLNHVTVSIEPDAKNFPDGLDKSLRKTGDFHFLLRPYSAVKWSVGPAAVYSFVRDPEFKAVADGDKFKIEKTQDDFRKFAVGAMLTLAPRALDWGNLALTFNVGVTGEKKLGFLLGTSLSAGPLFTLGGGVAFQQAHRLSASQTVGQQLDKAEDLKIDDRFKSGLYIFLAVKIPTGGKSATN